MGCGSKILGAVALAVLVSVGASAAADYLVSPKPLAKNVFVVDASAAPAATTAAPKGPAAIAPLLATADVATGKKIASVCAACHSFGKGEAAKVGPNLYGVVGGPHAHMAGFAYSDAMKALHDKTWTFDELNQFLYSPRDHIAGTKMTFAGIKKDADRANVIAYLRSLADKPVALPKE